MGKILKVRIDNISFNEVVAKIKAHLMIDNADHIFQIATVNPEFIMAAQIDTKFKEILNQTDLNVPDGIGLQGAARILNQKINERITGVDLTWELCKIAAESNYSIFFLGGAPGVAEKAAYRVKLLNHELKIAGTYAGTPNENGLIQKINDSGADILLVAFGSPKQEKFIFNNKHQLKAKIAIGVGGTFDYIAGITPYAPSWMRKIGLEWLYRLLTQPKRWLRIFTAVVLFPCAVFASRLKK